ncbi:TPA: recombinase family protein [Clostridium perfringens]|nr:recombinase family protein [Clostridium perfringens]
MKIGYARVSTSKQDLDTQLNLLNAEGCERIFEEKISGTKKNRPQLQRLLDTLRAGDTVVISELTRLSRSTKDLFVLVDTIQEKGANIKSLKDSWVDTTTPIGSFMFSVMAGISQFERDLISLRTKEGLEASRKKGKVGGRPKTKQEKIDAAIRLKETGLSVSEITNITGVSKTSLYRALKEYKQSQQ